MTTNELPKFLTDPNPEVYLNDDYLVLDFETTTIGKGLAVYPENRIVSVAWTTGVSKDTGDGVRLPIHYRRAGEFDLGDLVNSVQRASFIVAHNAKFELQWLARCGLDLTNVLVFDTQIAEYVLGGNRYGLWDLGLDTISARRGMGRKLDIIKMFWDVGIGTEDIPEWWLERYCVQDVRLTTRLFLAQRKELHSLGLLPVHYNRCLLTPVLADIEKNGVVLDEDLVRTRLTETETEYAETQRRLDLFAGGINWGSRIQLADFIYDRLGFDERSRRERGQYVPDRTETGQRKTDQDTLERLKATTPKQQEFIELFGRSKELSNELTKYLRKWGDCCTENNSVLLATFNQTTTQTHRLSSSGLDYRTQFQNFPRQYKCLFKARNSGWLVGEADGAQLEFRVAVHLGRDRTGLLDITSGADIHSVTASVIWPDEPPKSRRQDAKPHTFKPLYGGQSGTEAEKRYYKFFREKYKGVTDAQNRWKDVVLETKALRTEWGLVYYWPDTYMDRNGYIRNSTAICNYPVQAFATAEIIPIALVWFWHRLKRSALRLFIVNTVHDSIVVELPQEEVQAFHELSKQCLIDDTYRFLKSLYGIDFTVPLGAGVTTGDHWGSKNETKYEAPLELWEEAAKKANMM